MYSKFFFTRRPSTRHPFTECVQHSVPASLMEVLTRAASTSPTTYVVGLHCVAPSVKHHLLPGQVQAGVRPLRVQRKPRCERRSHLVGGMGISPASSNSIKQNLFFRGAKQAARITAKREQPTEITEPHTMGSNYLRGGQLLKSSWTSSLFLFHIHIECFCSSLPLSAFVQRLFGSIGYSRCLPLAKKKKSS